MFRSNVFPVKSGFSRAGKKKGRGKKKKMVDGSLARRRFNDSQPRYFALFVRVCTRRVPLQGIQKNLAI